MSVFYFILITRAEIKRFWNCAIIIIGCSIIIIIFVIIIFVVLHVKNIHSILIAHGLIILIADRTGCFGEQGLAIGTTNQLQQRKILIIILLLVKQLKTPVMNLIEAHAQAFGEGAEKVVYFNRQMTIFTQFVQQTQFFSNGCPPRESSYSVGHIPIPGGAGYPGSRAVGPRTEAVDSIRTN